jgi:NAD-dependent deacetylase
MVIKMTIHKSNQEEEIAKAANVLRKAGNVTILTGAGVSAESSVPTFRGKDGLWKTFRAEELATPEAFKKQPLVVWEWYGHRQKLVSQCKPNPAHTTLVEMENYFSVFSLITQNVDGLHRRAGSRNVIELHGNLFKARCTLESEVFDFTLKDDPLPLCKKCGALIRPHVVWFGESLDSEIIDQAIKRSLECQVFIVVGTSALVQPAASLPLFAARNGATVIEINPDETPLTHFLDISIREKAGVALPEIWNTITARR